MPGTLYIIAAASGTGKTSLAKALAHSLDNMVISVSHTTRPIRNGEKADASYFFVDNESFEQMIATDAFLEYAKVFDHYYGTSRAFVEKQLAAGNDVVLDIDWQGTKLVQAKIPNCVSIFLLPPSKIILRERLENRKRDTAEIIAQRLSLASSEISHYTDYDYLVINDSFDMALSDLQTIVRANRLRRPVQAEKYAQLLQDLLT